MKLSPETWARKRPQRYPMKNAQAELPNMPSPMTANRVIDFKQPCKRCQIECDYCKGWKDFDPLGR